MFTSILSGSDFSALEVIYCTLTSLGLGFVIALIYHYKNRASQSMMLSLIILPALVQAVIMMVNGNIGAGVAIAGAFSLVRFRSNPGSAKDICAVFFAMAIGLATGMGYLGFAALMTLIVGVAYFIIIASKFGSSKEGEQQLKITIPENLNYSECFTDLFNIYTKNIVKTKVKTTNMGSMFEVTYRVVLKDASQEKAFIDELRCRNGNLPIVYGDIKKGKEELL